MATTRPAHGTTGSKAVGAVVPVRARAGPAAPSARAAAKRIPPDHSTDPGAPLRPRNPGGAGAAAVHPGPRPERGNQAGQAHGQWRGGGVVSGQEGGVGAYMGC